jgi:hypothetical protein
MAKSYQAVYEQGRLRWLGNPPTMKKARVLVTVLDPESPTDIVRADQVRQRLEQTRGAWGKTPDPATLDAEIKAMRDEWRRPWELSETAADQ